MPDPHDTESPERSAEEYRGERDMDRFWATAKLSREPLKQLWYVPVLLVLVVISIPWYRVGQEDSAYFLGLPVWVWIPLACTLGLSILTTIAALKFWGDDDPGSD